MPSFPELPISPHIGDQVVLLGTQIVGDVTRVSGGNQGPVSFRVTRILGKAATARSARAFHGAWVTCPAELLAPRSAPANSITTGRSMNSPELRTLLQAPTDRLFSEFSARYSREQIERQVDAAAAQYADARVTTFVPVLVYREARASLQAGLN